MVCGTPNRKYKFRARHISRPLRFKNLPVWRRASQFDAITSCVRSRMEPIRSQSLQAVSAEIVSIDGMGISLSSATVVLTKSTVGGNPPKKYNDREAHVPFSHLSVRGEAENSMPVIVSFIAGAVGAWRIDRVMSVKGESLLDAPYLKVTENATSSYNPSCKWSLRGFTSNARYSQRAEQDLLSLRQEKLQTSGGISGCAHPDPKIRRLVDAGARRASRDL